jgi:hypothetical protein
MTPGPPAPPATDAPPFTLDPPDPPPPYLPPATPAALRGNVLATRSTVGTDARGAVSGISDRRGLPVGAATGLAVDCDVASSGRCTSTGTTSDNERRGRSDTTTSASSSAFREHGSRVEARVTACVAGIVAGRRSSSASTDRDHVSRFGRWDYLLRVAAAPAARPAGRSCTARDATATRPPPPTQ